MLKLILRMSCAVIFVSVMMCGCVSYNRSSSDTGITTKNASGEALGGSVVTINSEEMTDAKIDNMTPDEWLSEMESKQVSGCQVNSIDPVISLGASSRSDKRELLEQLNKSNWGSFTSDPKAQQLIREAVRDGALPRSYASGIVLGGYSLVAPTAIIKLVFNPINNQLSLCYMGNGHKNFLFQGTAKGKLSFQIAQIGNKMIWSDAGELKSKDIQEQGKLYFQTARIGNKVIWSDAGELKSKDIQEQGKQGKASISSLGTNPDAVVNWWVSIQNNYTGEDGRFDAVSFAQSGRSGEITDISIKKN